MKVQDLMVVGTIQKSFGLKGAVKVSFETFFLEFTDNLTVFFTEERDNFIPYFVEKLEIRFDGTGVAKLEDVDVKEEAMLLNGKTIYVEIKKYPGLQEAALDEDYYGDLVGLEAILLEADNLNLGKITEIEYLPEHECAKLIYKGIEILLPLHDDILDAFDDEKAYFNLNEDYLSIYFEEDGEKDDD